MTVCVSSYITCLKRAAARASPLAAGCAAGAPVYQHPTIFYGYHGTAGMAAMGIDPTHAYPGNFDNNAQPLPGGVCRRPLL